MRGTYLLLCRRHIRQRPKAGTTKQRRTGQFEKFFAAHFVRHDSARSPRMPLGKPQRLLVREGRIQWKVKCRESTFLLLPLSPRVASDCSPKQRQGAKEAIEKSACLVNSYHAEE
ncbi:hypothetical protein CDAR_449851 [Caerostris darwini]|uniref:Uncharacterized protein n=1 Tax=Caerostris darwini TaxID=1538125 RepID=A0AAV4QS56_9ARAC|nr:hypothetical protein CDAR_449851 [Caerostris darwini]